MRATPETRRLSSAPTRRRRVSKSTTGPGRLEQEKTRFAGAVARQTAGSSPRLKRKVAATGPLQKFKQEAMVRAHAPPFATCFMFAGNTRHLAYCLMHLAYCPMLLRTTPAQSPALQEAQIDFDKQGLCACPSKIFWAHFPAIACRCLCVASITLY